MTELWATFRITDVERPWQLLAVAAALGVAFQALFWGAAPGLNAPVMVGLLLAAAVWAARGSSVALTAGTAAVMGVAATFSLAIAVRAEPTTTAVNVLVALGSLAILVHAYPSEHWLRYGLRDWLLAALHLTGHGVTGPPSLLVVATRRRSARTSTRSGWRRALPVARGVLIALPIVAVFAVLLASADAVFAQWLTAITDLVQLPDMDEAVGRTIVAGFVAWAVAGGLWHQLQRRWPRVLADEAIPRVLGFTEAGVVLLAVDLLFAAFVAVQARYFFGGTSAVVAEGLSYAEYARRGFAELAVVAVASLGLHLVLAGLTRREGRAQRIAFSALTSTLTCLVLVILASSFARLLLYEQAFGFTRARTVAHVFMVWLGLLLVTLLVLELRDQVRLFLLASLVAAVGFAATLNVVGVDALITRQNVAHAQAGGELDGRYLASLSPDAAPALARALAVTDGPLATELRTALTCTVRRAEADDWRSLRLADVRARRVAGGAQPTPPVPAACLRW